MNLKTDEMNKCLEKIELSKLTGKEENPNRPVAITEIQSVPGLFSREEHSTSPVIRELPVKAAA